MKNFFFSAILIYFTISVAGIPVALHYCDATGSITAEECDLCATQPIEENSCCAEENEYSEIINAVSSDCCSELIIVSSIAEELLITKETRFEHLQEISPLSTIENFSAVEDSFRSNIPVEFPPGGRPDIPVTFHSLLI